MNISNMPSSGLEVHSTRTNFIKKTERKKKRKINVLYDLQRHCVVDYISIFSFLLRSFK